MPRLYHCSVHPALRSADEDDEDEEEDDDDDDEEEEEGEDRCLLPVGPVRHIVDCLCHDVAHTLTFADDEEEEDDDEEDDDDDDDAPPTKAKATAPPAAKPKAVVAGEDDEGGYGWCCRAEVAVAWCLSKVACIRISVLVRR